MQLWLPLHLENTSNQQYYLHLSQTSTTSSPSELPWLTSAGYATSASARRRRPLPGRRQTSQSISLRRAHRHTPHLAVFVLQQSVASRASSVLLPASTTPAHHCQHQPLPPSKLLIATLARIRVSQTSTKSTSTVRLRKPLLYGERIRRYSSARLTVFGMLPRWTR